VDFVGINNTSILQPLNVVPDSLIATFIKALVLVTEVNVGVKITC
jgi:hypothetical protein